MPSMATGAVCAPSTDRAPSTVISFASACEAANLSPSTLRRLIVAGHGPRVLKLSERRIGIRRADLDAWLASRAVSS